ncbi:hypothetical protein AHF37_11021 [Paragonimus kellicotti]|nr:hypothetical protein AHF37_11021 [Paragonimus kellicotti]
MSPSHLSHSPVPLSQANSSLSSVEAEAACSDVALVCTSLRARGWSVAQAVPRHLYTVDLCASDLQLVVAIRSVESAFVFNMADVQPKLYCSIVVVLPLCAQLTCLQLNQLVQSLQSLKHNILLQTELLSDVAYSSSDLLQAPFR